MSAALALAEAVTALVAQKRAVGYTYDTEARVLARFEAFSRREFPGVDRLTEVSVNAWIAVAHRREVKPATLQILAAPVRELAREMRTTERGFASHRPPQQTVASHPRAWHSGNTVESMYQWRRCTCW